MSRYSWVKNSFSITGAFPTGLQDIYLDIPARSTVKRFQIRNTYVSMNSENPDQGHIRSPAMHARVEYLQIPEPTRTIYSTIRRIPFEWSTMFAAAVPVYDYQASAGDLELGVDQPCSYGKLTGPVAQLHLAVFVYAYPFLPNDYSGEWDLEFAALVFT